MIDPRSCVGVISTFEAHSGEISDMAVLNDGISLVTTGWSRQPNGSLRIDRLVYVSSDSPYYLISLVIFSKVFRVDMNFHSILSLGCRVRPRNFSFVYELSI